MNKRKIGFISGVFDCLHEGHITLLKSANAFDIDLIVSINHDEYVTDKKGKYRPIDTALVRKRKLMESGFVKEVIINSDDSPLNLINKIKPYIIFVGDDYTEDTTVGAKEVKSWGGKVVFIKRVGDISTTKIIQQRNMRNMRKIHITGGLGFIGSNLIKFLNEKGIVPYIYDKSIGENWRNVVGLSFSLKPIEELTSTYISKEDVLIHLGANVDTREKMNQDLWSNNFEFSCKIIHKFKRVVYASSAATYGAEEENFKERIYGLKPLNAYGFTKWAVDEYFFGNGSDKIEDGKKIFGLRFFNVYGPNEVLKGDMQSVVSKVINKLPPLYKTTYPLKINKTETENIDVFSLFKSDRDGIPHGDQRRDFIYVEDVCKVINFFIDSDAESGIYNLGSGKARSFHELILTCSPRAEIFYADMPESLKGQYQYFTQADLTKLREAGYMEEFTTLEDGVQKTKDLTG